MIFDEEYFNSLMGSVKNYYLMEPKMCLRCRQVKKFQRGNRTCGDCSRKISSFSKRSERVAL